MKRSTLRNWKLADINKCHNKEVGKDFFDGLLFYFDEKEEREWRRKERSKLTTHHENALKIT